MVTFKLKNYFFDRDIVKNAMDAKSVRALSRVGAFIRRTARTSIRKSKKTAAAGQPPRSHSQDDTISIRNIQFGYDTSTRSMVIGPVQLNSKSGTSAGVPNLLEFGGEAVRGKKTLTYAPHPFMGPALEANRDEIPAEWRNGLMG